jgi:hypothetical protein
MRCGVLEEAGNGQKAEAILHAAAEERAVNAKRSAAPVTPAEEGPEKRGGPMAAKEGQSLKCGMNVISRIALVKGFDMVVPPR